MKETLSFIVFCETSETCETIYEKAVSRPASGCESCVTFVSRVTKTFRMDLKRLRNRFCIEKERAISGLFRMFLKTEHKRRYVS
jgi:hypothetical protein